MSVTETSSHHPKLTLGSWTVEALYDATRNYNKYSKGWHRAHGPYRTADNRRVVFTRPWGKHIRTRTVYLDSWAGDYLARAVLALGLGTKGSKVPLKIRLNKAYGARLLEEEDGYKIYSRTLLGAHVDYVLVSPSGGTYHSVDKEYLRTGLMNKVVQSRSTTKQSGPVSYQSCRALGFCGAGIKTFCRDFGISSNGKYSMSDLRKAVHNNLAEAQAYGSELQTLAKAYGLNSKYFTQGD